MSTETPRGRLNTIGGRLRYAIERQPHRGRKRGVRLFQRRIEERGRELKERGEKDLQGVTLPSIMTYLNDDVEPSFAFIREAADILDHRAVWIAFGEGLPTVAEMLGVMKETSAEVDAFRAAAEGPVIEALEMRKLTGGARVALYKALRRVGYLDRFFQEYPGGTEHPRALADRFGRAIAGPLSAFDLRTSDCDVEDVDDYLVAVITAVALIVERTLSGGATDGEA